MYYKIKYLKIRLRYYYYYMCMLDGFFNQVIQLFSCIDDIRTRIANIV